jgi:hypothetical protein
MLTVTPILDERQHALARVYRLLLELAVQQPSLEANQASDQES